MLIRSGTLKSKSAILTRMSRVVALAKFQAVTRDILQSYFFLSKLVEDWRCSRDIRSYQW